MKPTIHQIDPNGDTLLVLCDANAPFAVLPSPADELAQKEEGEPSSPPPADETLQKEENQVGSSTAEDPDDEPKVQMRLSSKHLALASTYFAKLTANDWKETTGEDSYAYLINAREWDEEALLILMNIIHGRTAKVPEVVNLELLAKISVLVDYYQCHDAVEFFVKTWIKSLSIPAISCTGRDAFLRLSVAWVFSEASFFHLLTKTIILESKASIDTLGLPIPHGVIDALNEKREDIISGLMLGLHNLKIELCGDESLCSYECSSMSLGNLSKCMYKMGILDPHPDPPYLGHSVLALEKAIRGIKDPSSQSGCPGNFAPPRKTAAPPKPRTTTLSGTSLFGTSPGSSNPSTFSVAGFGSRFGSFEASPGSSIPSTTGASLFGTSPAPSIPSTTGASFFRTSPAPSIPSTSGGLFSTPPISPANSFCKISTRINIIMDKQLPKMVGLKMKDFVSQL
ncbi:hypothetical protein ACHAQJ_010716 [Trichoderma viride]